jgi:hypothetical protein
VTRGLHVRFRVERSIMGVAGYLTAQVEEVVVLQAADGLELATNVEVLGGREEVLDTGVGVIVAAKDQLGFLDPVTRH